MFLCKVIIGVLVCSQVFVNSFHIDIRKKDSVRVNGKQINTNSILENLEDYEKEFIFGKSRNLKSTIQFAHVLRNETAERRRKRSTDEGQISIKLQVDSADQVDLKLEPTPKLIDDAFILIRRYGNSSQFIEGSHKLAAEYAKCFYRSENAALDLCDDAGIRGIIRHNKKDLLIHPLPKRFGDSNHVIIKSEGRLHSDIELPSKNFQFEPEEEDFHEKASPHQQLLLDRTHFTNHRRHHTSNHSHRHRRRRHIASNRILLSHLQPAKIPQVLHIETAIFVDRDLFQHMAQNFPKNTESHLIRFVLAMVNGVQLLYNHPSLGHQINFVLKRLEILHNDPNDLRRSRDIDTYLNNFCMWQKKLNPPSDTDAVHYDHAVILTGLDLHVITKNGKISSQVVGLAPVAGMCTSTSSCTINEGKHFESVFVVAHEIGHNLGMRHDTNENSCDPSLYIMSPTLGSGKITWSKCSRNYLNNFLESSQASCLFDRGQFGNSLDHAAEGMLPGERFDADQQCMLKYGKDSIRSRNQIISDICRDLHCQKDRFTWTSHPALEGTECGEMMWCRSGVCVMRATFLESYSSPKQVSASKFVEKANFVEGGKLGQLRHDYSYKKGSAAWGDWSQGSACDSGCLYGESGRLREGSTGLRIFARSCLDYRRRCQGKDKKYESCVAKQCASIAKITIEEFATQVCERAMKFDTELNGQGMQLVGETVEESCKVFCKTKVNGTKSRSWTFPDGTTCRSKLYNFDDTSYCIAGRCERFSCDNSTANYFKMDMGYCPKKVVHEESKNWNNVHTRHYLSHHQDSGRDRDRDRDFKSVRETAKRSKYENEVNSRPSTNSNAITRKTDNYQHVKYNLDVSDAKSSTNEEWIVKSGCHFGCMDKGKGVQVVSAKRNGSNNIQLCSPKIKPCDNLQTTAEYAENVCSRYKLKVRGISGYGMQISPSVHDPDRSCRVACQDEVLHHRFYIVNGNYGYFPLGTKCSIHEERYCVNGKCLEFGANDIPLTRSHISLALYRTRRDVSASEPEGSHRSKRSFLYYSPINITETVTQDLLNSIISNLSYSPRMFLDDSISNDHIEFMNPIHVTPEELITE